MAVDNKLSNARQQPAVTVTKVRYLKRPVTVTVSVTELIRGEIL